MTNITSILVALFGGAALVAGAAPQFEVASIRRCVAGERGGSVRSPNENPTPGSVYLPCTTVKNLVHLAYGMSKPYAHTVLQVPIERGPAWMDSERYTINAKAAGDPGPEVTRGPMLQALLEDRFQLKIHRETREIPVYALTVAKGGPKLETFQEGSCVAISPDPPRAGQKPFCGVARSSKKETGLTMEFFGMSVDEFAKNLGANSGPNLLDRPVLDKTGIAGRFNFRLTYAPDGDAAADPAGPSIFTAVQEQLGLKLESSRGLGEFLVIDHLERPSEN